MASTEEQIQQTVVSLEAGELAKWLWRTVFVAVAMGLSVFYLVHVFRGLSNSQAMDQAQIGREIIRGNGWQTKFYRPLAIGELRRDGKDVKTAIHYDTYNAPIPPLLDAVAIYAPVKNGWNLSKTDFVYSGDRAMACMGVIFFLVALIVFYCIALELFDQRLAYIATGLVLMCDMMWHYAISGLPQMFLLLVLHLSVYAILRAMRARYLSEGNMGWIAAIGAGFGVMALTHALSIFIFVPVLAFSFVFFGPRKALVVLGVFLAVYTPWLVRNAMVCGDLRGVAGLSGLDGIVRSESGHMRRFDIDLGETSGNYYAQNFRVNLMAEVNRLIEYMGWGFAAPVAFVSVLHAFRRPITATFRWLLFTMLGSAVAGMSIFGMKEEGGLGSNQFYLLFVPMLTCYGMAYILVQWDRRIGLGFILPQWSNRSAMHTLMRVSIIVGIFSISSIPLVTRMFIEKIRWQVEWPPYTPPYISALRDMTEPDEIIASDMPWAVAWYADRPSLWMPYDANDLTDLSDYKCLGASVVALYFTPLSGTQNVLGDLVNGEYRHWTGYIVRTVDLTKSPYPVKTLLGMPDCVLYTDRDRLRPAAK